MDAPSGDERLAALRAELRALGYLENRLERFVLGDFVSRPGLLAPALRASLRVALVAAPLAAAAVVAADLAWSPLLRARPLDVAVVAAYTLLMLLPAAFALNLTGVAAALLARGRPAAVARVVGAAITAISAAYALLWWGLRVRDLAAGLVVDLAILLVLAATAVLVGRAAGLSALAVALELKGGGGGARGGPAGAREVEATVAGLALVLALIAGGALFGLGEPEVKPASAITLDPTGVRVALVAVDGLALEDLARPDPPPAAPAAWTGVRELAARGQVYRLGRPRTTVPPVVWTTAATGRDPLDHGVQSLLVARLPGVDVALASGYGRDAFRAVLRGLLPLRPPRAPLTERLRRERTFWEVASDAGLEVVAVNWWATYPAHVARGSVVSDRAYATLAAGGRLGREAWPPALANALALAGLGGDGGLAPPALAAGPSAREAARSDAFHAAVAIERVGAARADLAALYLQALDVLWSEDGSVAARAAGGYSAFLDGVLDGMRHAVGEGGVVVLAGEPGRARPGATGLLVLAGGPIRAPATPAAATTPAAAAPRPDTAAPAQAAPAASLEDLAPTLLHLVGLPASAEMPGRVLAEALEPTFLAANPLRRVDRFGRRPPRDLLADDPTDEAESERLRSLGYVD